MRTITWTKKYNPRHLDLFCLSQSCNSPRSWTIRHLAKLLQLHTTLPRPQKTIKRLKKISSHKLVINRKHNLRLIYGIFTFRDIYVLMLFCLKKISFCQQKHQIVITEYPSIINLRTLGCFLYSEINGIPASFTCKPCLNPAVQYSHAPVI